MEPQIQTELDVEIYCNACDRWVNLKRKAQQEFIYIGRCPFCEREYRVCASRKIA